MLFKLSAIYVCPNTGGGRRARREAGGVGRARRVAGGGGLLVEVEGEDVDELLGGVLDLPRGVLRKELGPVQQLLCFEGRGELVDACR